MKPKQLQKNSLYLLGIGIILRMMLGCSLFNTSEPLEIKISVDKTVIKANGTDKAVFTVTANGEDVTSSAVINWKSTPEGVSAGSFSTRVPDVYTFYASYEGQQSNEITVEATEVVLSITADCAAIKANNRDVVTFTVRADDEEVTDQATIVLAGEPETVLESVTFSTKTAKAYTFYATYDGHKSNELAIEATAVVLSITADRSEIKANNKDIVTFTVRADDEEVTDQATVILAGEPETVLASGTFSTKTVKTYTFYATYDGDKSGEISVEAIPVVLALKADRLTFKADEKDKITFSVTADDEDVTSSASIFRKGEDADEPLEGMTFITDQPGAYRFYATYDEDTTDIVQVEASYVARPYLRQHLIMQFSGTLCPNCPLMTDAVKEAQQQELASGRIVHVICLHLYGKHCYSTLAGAIAGTSNALSSDVYFPSSLVDLREEVILYETGTSRRLTDALKRPGTAPAETGIAIESQINGTSIDFKVKIRTTRTDRYRFYAFIVEDRIKHGQKMPTTGEWDGTYVHDNIGTYVIPDADPRTGVMLGEIEPGKETVQTFSLQTSSIQMEYIDAQRKVNLANCRIVGYTLKPSGEDAYVLDNVVSCPANGSIPFVYN
ncbi:MAG: Omp28-related outer membrane protein [Tannerella sp.]|nr:Omp28-related outer membrane protein [Tannerella sp.]